MTEAVDMAGKDGKMNFGLLTQTAGQIRQSMAEIEVERQKISAMRNLFDTNTNVEYQNATNEISYQTGTTSNQTYNYYNTVKVDVGTFFGEDEETLYELANIIAPYLEQVAIKR
jgi:hypothetical protein